MPAALAFFTGASQFEQPIGDLHDLGRRHRPDHHHGSDLPAPNRRGPHRRRGEGIKERKQMAQITLDNLTKRYPDGYEAVRDMAWRSRTASS